MDYAWNAERERAEREARYTILMYEQLLALKPAAETIGLSAAAVREMLYDNAQALVAGAL